MKREMLVNNYSGYDQNREGHVALVGICGGLQSRFHAGEVGLQKKSASWLKGG